MKLFGKTLGEYVSFEWIILVLVIVIGLLRLFLSIEGIPDSTVKWASVTVLMQVGVIYYGIRVYTSGFGSYKNLLPLIFIQNLVTQAIIIFGIVVGMVTHKDNIYTAKDFARVFDDGKSFAHIAGHLTVGLILFTIVYFLLSALIMLITKLVYKKPQFAH
jgi:hypothetical protein